MVFTNTWLITGAMVPVVWAGCKYGGLYDSYLEFQETWHKGILDKRAASYRAQDDTAHVRDLKLWREYKTGELEKRLKVYGEENEAMAKMGWWNVLFGGRTYREVQQAEEARANGKRAAWGMWGGQGSPQ